MTNSWRAGTGIAVLIVALFCPALRSDAQDVYTQTFPLAISTGCSTGGWGSCPTGGLKVYPVGSLSPTGTVNWGCSFLDRVPTPSQMRVIEVNLRIKMERLSPDGGTPRVTAVMNGVPMGQANVTNGPLCNYQEYTFSTGRYDQGVPGYTAGGMNAYTFQIDYSWGIEFASPGEVEVKYVSMAAPLLEITDTTPETDRRVLLHKYGTHDVYPSELQRRRVQAGTPDGEMEIRAQARNSDGTPAAGVWLYFKIEDANGSGTTNLGTAPSLVPNKLQTDGQGWATVVLKAAANTASGNQYRVKSSRDEALQTNPSYVCGTRCAKTGVITTWKRVYYETDRMFQHGAYLTTDATPPVNGGSTWLEVSDARQLRNANQVRLIHAPRITAIGPDVPYYDDVAVLRVDTRANRIQVAALPRAYDGPETVDGALRPYLADAVGVITGDANVDFFASNPEYVAGLFVPAFVEYVEAGDDPAPYLPFEASVEGTALQSSELTLISRKWFFHYVNDNHNHLLGASEKLGDPGLLGLTTARIGTNWSWVWVNRVRANAPRRGGREWIFDGEVTAHELTHQWQVNNPVQGGHCSFPRMGSSQFCTMWGSYDDFGNCAGTCPEFYDTIVGFHYVVNGSTVDSEYLMIRQRTEPLPQY